MTQYNSVNVKVSNLQLNKLKSATKDSTGITLRLLSYMTDLYMIDKGNFLHKLLLTSRHVSNHSNAFTNNLLPICNYQKQKFLKS